MTNCQKWSKRGGRIPDQANPNYIFHHTQLLSSDASYPRKAQNPLLKTANGFKTTAFGH